MASPQKENGYTPIANEIMEALSKTRIPGEARQILDLIFRLTYGFAKTMEAIPLSRFSKETGLSRNTVCRAIKKLVDMKVVSKKETRDTTEYRFNKNYEDWEPVSKKSSLFFDNHPVPNSGLHNKYIYKTNSNSNELEKPKGFGNPQINEIIDYLKTKQELPKLDDTTKWNRIYAKHLLRQFKQDVERIKRFIDFTMTDPFHKSNATSMKYLYMNLGKIALKAKSMAESKLKI